MDNQLYQKLVDEIKSYLQVRYDLVRLSVLEKMSKILGLVLVTFVVILLIFVFLSLGAVALSILLAQWLPTWSAFLIVGALVLVLIALTIIFREKWFLDPLVRTLSTILFADKPEESSNQP
ncbi:MAG: phage holin family protein [Paludibacteraceae bacterium]|nr:phage holin family protein [Paludibacteraceae bacterium]